MLAVARHSAASPPDLAPLLPAGSFFLRWLLLRPIKNYVMIGMHHGL